MLHSNKNFIVWATFAYIYHSLEGCRLVRLMFPWRVLNAAERKRELWLLCCCCLHAGTTSFLLAKWEACLGALWGKRLKLLLAGGWSSSGAEVSDSITLEVTVTLELKLHHFCLHFPAKGKVDFSGGKTWFQSTESVGECLEHRSASTSHQRKGDEKEKQSVLNAESSKEEWVLITGYFLHPSLASVCSSSVSTNSPDLSYTEVQMKLWIEVKCKEKHLIQSCRGWRKRLFRNLDSISPVEVSRKKILRKYL